MIVQRLPLPLPSGSSLSNTGEPGANRRSDVLGVQERLAIIGLADPAALASETELVRSRAPDQTIPAGEIQHTTLAAIQNEKPQIDERLARVMLGSELVGGVGVGQLNDVADVDLVLNLVHEEWHIANADFDASIARLRGVGRTVDPAVLPGFLDALVKVRKYYLGGWPRRGTSAGRKGLIVPEGTKEYQDALDRNDFARFAVTTWIDEAVAQTENKMLKNSAEWVKSGKVQVHSITRTHDSAARAAAAGHPGEIAYFPYPAGAITETPARYQRKLAGEPAYVNDNVTFRFAEGGHQDGTRIAIADPVTAGKEYVFATLRHEIQHAVDEHAPNDEGSYTTEFNARVAEGRFDVYSPTAEIQMMGHTWTRLQWAVFKDLWDHPALYPYVRANWNQPSNPAAQAAWRKHVLDLKAPSAWNPINSVRVSDLDAAIRACDPDDFRAYDREKAAGAPPNAKATAVAAALDALDDVDKAALPRLPRFAGFTRSWMSGSLRDRLSALVTT